MNNEYIEKLRSQVKKALTKDKMRFRHTIGVADTSACLAMRYGVNIEDAYIAGLLHDCAKCVPDDKKITECQEYGLEITEYELKSPYLLHSKLGAAYAYYKYDVKNQEICDAIKYHTTGRPAMTMLEKIVFIADYIEPYRNKAGDLDRIREKVFIDIDYAIYEVTRDTLDYLKRKNAPIDPMTSDTFQYYNSLIKNR